jgi:hypothetical protein
VELRVSGVVSGHGGDWNRPGRHQLPATEIDAQVETVEPHCAKQASCLQFLEISTSRRFRP